MPKRNKTKNDDVCMHEGKPPGLCLGDFVVTNRTTTSVMSENCSGVSNQEGSAAIKIDSNASTSNAQSGYFVCRTKKGGIPVKVENRASGKKVTLIEHVLGDGKALVSELKSKFGTGGIFKDGIIELQGDLLPKVTRYFNDNKELLKPYGTKF